MASQTTSFAHIKPEIERVLEESFGPGAAVSVEQGYAGRAHVKIVTPKLNGLTEEQKQQLVWDALRRGLGEDAQLVAFVLPYGMDEL